MLSLLLCCAPARVASCFAMSLRLVLLLAALLPTTARPASRLTNVSVRASAGSGADTLIVGFSISGSGAKQLLLRGIGPSLTTFGVSGAVVDPELKLFDQATRLVTSNDNWGGASTISTTTDAVGAFRLPAGSSDAALLLSLTAGSYSAHLVANSGPGIALVEGYDADTGTPTAQISNISTRSLAGTGAGVLTIGFGISSDTPKTVLIRAVGPSLDQFGVTGTLADPQLRLFSSRNHEIGYNNDWLTGANWSPAFTSVGAFGLVGATRDSALLVTLAPGTYTAQASGVNNTSGVALIEVYDVTAPPATSFVYQPFEIDEPINYPHPPTPQTIPAVQTQARPVYPFDLRRAGAEGSVLVQFIVEPDGRVSNAIALRAHDTRFADSAVAAVSQWTFRAGRNTLGQNVATIMQVPIIYTLTE
jgi:TonB family protein